MCARFLRKALIEVLPTRIGLPVALERQGHRSIAFRAHQVDGVKVVIKLTRGRNSYPEEQWVYHEYARAQVPVPRVLYYSASLPGIGCPCLVMTMIDGVPLFDADTPNIGLYGEVGEMLGKMHTVALPAARFGLGAFLPSATEWYHSWPAFVTAQHAHPTSGEYLRRHGLWPDCAEDLTLLSAKNSAHHFRCVLNHGDFGPDHILVRAGQIAGVIDPGECFAGPPEYDLAHIALYISECQLRQVLNHYPGQLDLEMVHVYAAVIALHKAGRAHRESNAVRANSFAVIARHHCLLINQQDAPTPGTKLSCGLPSGRYTEI